MIMHVGRELTFATRRLDPFRDGGDDQTRPLVHDELPSTDSSTKATSNTADTKFRHEQARGSSPRGASTATAIGRVGRLRRCRLPVGPRHKTIDLSAVDR
jgi:hypothetical protein